MKRKDLIKLLKQKGFYISRNGSRHDVYTNGKKSIPVPRHNEIKETTAKEILKQAGE